MWVSVSSKSIFYLVEVDLAPSLTRMGWGMIAFECAILLYLRLLRACVLRDLSGAYCSGLSLWGLRWKMVLWNSEASYL